MAKHKLLVAILEVLTNAEIKNKIKIVCFKWKIVKHASC